MRARRGQAGGPLLQFSRSRRGKAPRARAGGPFPRSSSQGRGPARGPRDFAPRSDPFLRPAGLRRSRSQHFLIDREILRTEAEALQPQGKTVLEIGAGDGRLSERILALRPASLLLVELDPHWAGRLRAKFNRKKGVKILQQDVLDLPDDARFDGVIGNIPYQITSPILLKLARWTYSRAILCVQKEVAERMQAPSGSSEYGRFSVFAQLHFEIRPLLSVPRTSFHPPPNVDSVVLALQPKPDALALPAHLDVIGAALFSHRLASVANALRHERRRWGWDKAQARAMAIMVKYAARKVFTLTPQEVADIAARLPAPNPGGVLHAIHSD